MARGRLALLILLAALALPSAAQASHPEERGAVMHPLWGDATAANTERELDLLVAAGANSVRIDMGWATLEHAEGQFASWYVAKADAFFAEARERGLHVVVTFWLTPCWASSAPPDVKQDCNGEWWNRGVDRYPPADPTKYANGVRWVADRWGDDIDAIEVWNEPNWHEAFDSADPARDYAAILRAAYPAIKAVSPATRVLGGSILMSDRGFLEDLYDNGARGYFDALSMRPYNFHRGPYDVTDPYGPEYSYANGVPTMRAVMEANGDAARKIWFTEVGWSTCAIGSNHWCVTPEQQAQYIRDAFRMIRERWSYVGGAFVYNLRNKGTAPGREEQMGIVHRDFTPKPAYWSFQSVLAELEAAHPAPPPVLPPGGGGNQDQEQEQQEQQEGSSATTQQQPTPQPLPPPAPLPDARDATAPALRALAVSPRRISVRRSRRLLLTFRLSEPATVRVQLTRKRGRRWRALARPIRKELAAGTARVTPRRKFAAGLYQARLTAVDAAGNSSVVARATFRVTR